MAKKNLKNNEDHFHSIVDHAVDAIININSSGKIVYVNKSTCAAFDYKEADLLGKNVTILMPKKYRAEHKQSMGRFLKTHKPYIIGKTVELVGVKNDGTEFPIELSLSVMNDEQGTLFAGVIRDISDRKKVERDLAENQTKLEAAQRIAGMGFFDWHIRDEQIELSEQLIKICGLEPETKFVTRDFLPQIFYPADLEYIQKNLEFALRGEKELNMDHRLVWPDGTIRWVHVQAELTLDAKGKPETLLGTAIDITERRANVDKVESERDMAQKYFDITGTMIVVIGKDQKVKVINKKGCQILGRKESEIIGKNWFNLVIPAKMRAEVKSVFNKLVEGQIEPVEHFENFVETKSKEIRLIAWNNSVLYDTEGNITATLSSGEDITDRKEIESRLIEEEKRYRTLIESSAECICQLDLKGNFLFMNPTGRKSHDIPSVDELKKMNCCDLAEPAYHKVLKDTLKAAKTGEIQKFEYESETVDGLRWFESIMAPITDSSGKIASFIRLSNDITDRKKMEDELLESEKSYRTLVESSAECICQLDLKGNFLFMNPTGRKSHDIPSVDELKKMNCCDLAEPAYHKVLKDTLKAAKTGEIQKFEYESETVDGLRWFESIMAPITDSSGKITSFIRLSNDITDRKEKESLRRDNQEKMTRTLEGAVRALSITTALRDPYTVGHQERVSKLCCAIGDELGFSEDRLAGLRTAAELHDVGKVHVPAEILTKPGVISEHEFKIIQYHVQAGFDILEDIDFPWAVADFVVQHHERLNGSGYPNGLKEKDIFEEAKIIAVADVVEAMSSRRPYRAGLGIGVALKEISKNKGVLYDPKAVAVCLRLFRKKGFDFRSEKREKAA